MVALRTPPFPEAKVTRPAGPLRAFTQVRTFGPFDGCPWGSMLLARVTAAFPRPKVEHMDSSLRGPARRTGPGTVRAGGGPPLDRPAALPRRTRRPLLWAGAAALLALAAGCGSSGKPLTRSGPTVTPSTSSSSTSSSSSSVATTPASTQTLTVSPSSGLRASQDVLLTASGFSPGEALVVTECAAKGNATTSDDCNLAGMQSVVADAQGRVRVEFTVVKGPFGANRIVCSASQPCLVSVTQATPSPTQEADAPVSFS